MRDFSMRFKFTITQIILILFCDPACEIHTMDISIPDYKIIEKIGEGSFSEVLKVQHISSKVNYAAKRLKHIYKDEDDVLSCPEVSTVRRLELHPNVVGIHDIICEPLPGRITLILELMDMSLYDYIKNRKRCLSELKVKSFIYQLVCGLEHLHRNGIFHRDIKPENILIKLPKANRFGFKGTEVVQLADLGSVCSFYKSQPHTAYISTRWYRAPECLLTSGYYGPKMDIWSLGCVYYEMLTLVPLFPGDNELDQLYKIHEIIGSPSSRILSRFKHRTTEYVFPKKKPLGLYNLVPMLSENGLDILNKTLCYLPDIRIDVERLRQHVYFHGLRGSNRLTSGEFSSTPSLIVHQIKTNLQPTSVQAACQKNLKAKQYDASWKLKSCTTQSLDSFLYTHTNTASYQMLMRRRERAWGMNPGAAKTALLKHISTHRK